LTDEALKPALNDKFPGRFECQVKAPYINLQNQSIDRGRLDIYDNVDKRAIEVQFGTLDAYHAHKTIEYKKSIHANESVVICERYDAKVAGLYPENTYYEMYFKGEELKCEFISGTHVDYLDQGIGLGRWLTKLPLRDLLKKDKSGVAKFYLTALAFGIPEAKRHHGLNIESKDINTLLNYGQSYQNDFYQLICDCGYELRGFAPIIRDLIDVEQVENSSFNFGNIKQHQEILLLYTQAALYDLVPLILSEQLHIIIVCEDENAKNLAKYIVNSISTIPGLNDDETYLTYEVIPNNKQVCNWLVGKARSNMKFDQIAQNPDFSIALQVLAAEMGYWDVENQKISEKQLYKPLIKSTGKIRSIQPNAFLHSPMEADLQMLWPNIKELLFILDEDARQAFRIGCRDDLSILEISLTKSQNNFVDPIAMSICKKIKQFDKLPKKSLRSNFKHIQGDGVPKGPYFYFQGDGGFSKGWHMSIDDMLTVRKNPNPYIEFKDDNEKRNFRLSLNLNLYTWLIKLEESAIPAHLPFLRDYSTQWTDSMVYALMKFTQEEIDYIEANV
jgi:hypothetical protein